MTDLNKLALNAHRPIETTMQDVRVVADAFALNISKGDRYIQSDIVLENVDITAFASSGLAAAVGNPAAGDVRARTEVVLPLSDSAGTTAQSTRTVTLYGPGDITGLEPGMIIRRFPAPGTTDAEVTDLAHIEFDRPELPWAFSAAPARSGGSMRPWLALIVVDRATARVEHLPGLPTRLHVQPGELPDLSEAHLWGHAQTARTAVDLSIRLSPEYAPVNLSRLVSPRVLAHETDYIAALVPITDVGIRRGLGLSGGTLDYTWPQTGPDTVVLPVYDHWEFRTGPAGDFVSLALRLDGVPAPWAVGRKFIDTSTPGKPMGHSLSPGEPGAKQVLRCALFSPSAPPDAAATAAENATWPMAMVDDLAGTLNQPAQLGGVVERPGGDIPDLPIVGPRLYARGQRGASTVSGSDWFAQLNLSPINRIIAGLGTRVVQRDQEQLMQAAWAQIGEVLKANHAINLAHFSEEVAVRLHRRFDELQPGHLLQLVAPMAARIQVAQGRTLAADIAASSTPVMAVSGAFRRALRPHGPVVGRVSNAETLAGTIVGAGSTMRDFTRVYTNPDGIDRLSQQSVSLLNASRVATALGISEANVPNTINQASLDMKGGLFSHLNDQTKWASAPGRFDVSADIAREWLGSIMTESPDPVIEKIRKQRMGPLAATLALSSAPAAVGIKEDLKNAALKFNNAVITMDQVKPVAPGITITPISPVVTKPIVQVGRAPVTKKITSLGAGRLPTAITGVSRIDTGQLQPLKPPLPGAVSTTVTDEALRAFARLAPVQITGVLDSARATSASRLRAVIPRVLDPGGLLNLPATPRRQKLGITGLLEALNPRHTVSEALRGRLADAISNGWVTDIHSPIMAAPHFHWPMYRALKRYDEDWLLPGMNHLPGVDFVTVLAMNKTFMEAFMVGLSDEFGRELLWRGYPTDQRGTYFTRFWSTDKDDLTTQIHRFPRTDLGRHIAVGSDDGSVGSERAVVVVKGELIRRYPDALITLARKSGSGPATRFTPATELFVAHMEPDMAVIGFDLSINEMVSGGWWVVISEHPTAIRFTSRGHSQPRFLSSSPRPDSASWARTYIRNPIQVAFPATDIIKLEG